jgi:transcriptional regulator with XRE-family HTH domain
MEQTVRTLQDIGPVIRALRQRKKMTGVELGERAGLSQSKISKIETGVTLPTAKEVKNILNILNCPKTIRQRILVVYELDAAHPGSKYRSNYPQHALKREVATNHLRCAVLHGVPALLQTTAYREALQSHRNLTPKKFTQIMHETMRRQDLLWDKKRTFHFIIHEAALYAAPGSRDVQLAQLDRLERFCGMRRIKIGIIPLEAGLPTLETTATFVLYDTSLLVLVIGSQELTTDDPESMAEYVKVFGELHQKACYEDEAKRLICKALEFFG